MTSNPYVLLVEDNVEVRDYFTCVLRQIGAEVAEAGNGWSGLQSAAARTPDLIVTDLAMPGMDGVEMIRRLRGDSKMETVPVVVITAHCDGPEPERAWVAGCNAVVAKPCIPDTLMAVVDAFIGGRRRRLRRRARPSSRPAPSVSVERRRADRRQSFTTDVR